MQTARLLSQTDHTKHLLSEKTSMGLHMLVQPQIALTVPLLNMKNGSFLSLVTYMLNRAAVGITSTNQCGLLTNIDVIQRRS